MSTCNTPQARTAIVDGSGEDGSAMLPLSMFSCNVVMIVLWLQAIFATSLLWVFYPRMYAADAVSMV